MIGRKCAQFTSIGKKITIKLVYMLYYNSIIVRMDMRLIVLKNNIEIDVKVKCIEANKTQLKLAKNIGSSAPYIS